MMSKETLISESVINRGLPYYVNMADILEPIQEYLFNFNFLISDYEFTYQENTPDWDKDYLFISALDFFEEVSNVKKQFIWGVFSAIPKNISLKDVFNYEFPCAETSNLKILQHPLSVFEIICFDSSYVRILSKDENISKCFENRFPKDKYFKKWK